MLQQLEHLYCKEYINVYIFSFNKGKKRTTTWSVAGRDRWETEAKKGKRRRPSRPSQRDDDDDDDVYDFCRNDRTAP